MPDATNVVPASANSIWTLVPRGYGLIVWTKQPKRLNSVVWATTARVEPVSATTEVALKGIRGTRRRSAGRSVTSVVFADSGIHQRRTHKQRERDVYRS